MTLKILKISEQPKYLHDVVPPSSSHRTSSLDIDELLLSLTLGQSYTFIYHMVTACSALFLVYSLIPEQL